GSGGEPHLQWNWEIIEEIARGKNVHFDMALIHAEFPKEYIRKKLREGKIKPMGPNLVLTEKDIDETVRFVGQMGAEPLIKALNMGAEVILAGRSSDPAIYAALPLMKGYDPGLVWHASKIIECGALCAIPGTASDCIMAHLEKGYFLLEPLNPIRKCTPVSVAGHTLYEQKNPYYLYEPEGMMDLSQCKYEAYTDSTAKVSGSKWVPAKQQTIKIEGSARYGYRTISIAGCRDPLMIEEINEVTNHVREFTADNFKSRIDPKDYYMLFRLYGKDAVEGDLEPQKKITSQELGIIIEVVAKTQEMANDVCAVARSTMLHYHYTGRKATAGNLAFPYSPSDIPMGPAYRFSAYHLVELEDASELFKIEMVKV
ncbi:MAG: acyclic terpene utilization AtuA family protein, partial [Desulfobacteraceae bacterium]|nr:acyclic terpene utilization AtuA family protein [Desulfobacteraceae bacterium]